MIAVIVIGVLLARTTSGRYMYASGGNAEAARLAGVRVDAIRVLTFVVSGGAAGLAGVIDASRVLSAQAASGDGSPFTVLAGIVVGGTSILGGEGAVWRTFLGVLFIALIGNGYDLLGLDPLYEQITLGVILLAAVGSTPGPEPGPIPIRTLRRLPSRAPPDNSAASPQSCCSTGPRPTGSSS